MYGIGIERTLGDVLKKRIYVRNVHKVEDLYYLKFVEIDQDVLIEFNRNLESRMYYENQI